MGNKETAQTPPQSPQGTPEIVDGKLTRREFLTRSALSLGVLALAGCAPATAASALEDGQASSAPEVEAPKAFVESISEALPKERQIRFMDPGTTIEVPDIVADRLGSPKQNEVIGISDACRNRILKAANTMPFLPYLCDEVAILTHPTFKRRITQDDHIALGESLSVGVSSIVKKDKNKPFDSNNTTFRMTLFLPPDIVEGNLDIKTTHYGSIPYAKAKMPETLGDYIDWIVLHEGRHFADYFQRLNKTGYCPPLYDNKGSCQDLSRVLEGFLATQNLDDLSDFSTFAEIQGLTDVGEMYLNTDEMELAGRKIRAGETLYESKPGGGFTVTYDDGTYQFKAGFVREGYIPPEVQNLSDLAPRFQRGDIPRLYAFFNLIMEVEAEYWAWYKFNEKKGSTSFIDLLPKHARYFADLNEEINTAVVPQRTVT